MKITEQTLLSDVVSYDYRTASIFDKFGIDYCCNGKRTIAEASEDRPIDSYELIIHLNNVLGMQSNSENDYNSWP